MSSFGVSPSRMAQQRTFRFSREKDEVGGMTREAVERGPRGRRGKGSVRAFGRARGRKWTGRRHRARSSSTRNPFLRISGRVTWNRCGKRRSGNPDPKVRDLRNRGGRLDPKPRAGRRNCRKSASRLIFGAGEIRRRRRWPGSPLRRTRRERGATDDAMATLYVPDSEERKLAEEAPNAPPASGRASA